jgi:DNA-binding NtrC family response regulator
VNHLKASWLGSWKAPWNLDKGRRWGDPAWALATISQAWLLGGREGKWPQIAWDAKRPEGPQPSNVPDRFGPVPPEEWIALVRHGNALASPHLKGPRENRLVSSCWEALIRGDGSRWMALGTVLFDRGLRTRWIPVLGAVDAAGTLLLPPFLEHLLPPWILRLPQGWWEFLLSRTTSEGILLPEGPPPMDLPWALLEPEAWASIQPLVQREPPSALPPEQVERWAIQLDEGIWMLDPRLRAWSGGLGAHPKALGVLLPPASALGDPLPEPPQSIPSSTFEYPAPGTSAHPCADPIFWLEEGQRASRAMDYPGALNAFEWSCAHFTRLKNSEGTRRVAMEAVDAALSWGDVPSAEVWRKLRGPLEAREDRIEEAEFAAARGDWDRAVNLSRSLLREQPNCPSAAHLLVQGALFSGQKAWLEEARSLAVPGAWRDLLTASPDHAAPRCEPADPKIKLLWALRRAKSGGGLDEFWETWHACQAQPFKLEIGLQMLEQLEAQRTPERLLSLKMIADRIQSSQYSLRLDALWPATKRTVEESPENVLQAWLENRNQPTWILWEAQGHSQWLGHGCRPSDATVSALQAGGGLGPRRDGDRYWCGHSLVWEGIQVGHLFEVVDGQSHPEEESAHQIIAPWLARLVPEAKAEPILETGSLLTDGSEPMASLLVETNRVAGSQLPVLILGPTGSGKELLAHEIHERSGRTGPFIAINCSEYAESLMESELFGHVKGSFTGADRDRKGSIENAEGGTLFLDEVADLSPKLQSLLLRVLQEKEVRRVGAERVHKVNVRFLAATHRSLDEMVAAGTFRKDLHYRLKGVVLHLPSLRERRHEFPYLIPRLTIRIAKEAGLAAPELAPGLPTALARYAWPGNFRELRHAIERALLRSGGGILKVAHFPELKEESIEVKSWDEATRAFQRQFLLGTLKRHRFQITEVARTLGLTRPALYLAAKRLNLDLVKERALWEVQSFTD